MGGWVGYFGGVRSEMSAMIWLCRLTCFEAAALLEIFWRVCFSLTVRMLILMFLFEC